MEIRNKTDLAKHFNNLGYKVGAEVGVLDGDYALTLCKEISNLKYYGIDNWHIAEDMPNHKHRGKYEHVLEILKPYNAEIIKELSIDAVKKFEDASLDFVYIDANHRFDYVVMDIIEWTKKVRKGGIVSGHDYEKSKTKGVIQAVDGYISSHGLSLKVLEDTTWYFNKRWNI